RNNAVIVVSAYPKVYGVSGAGSQGICVSGLGSGKVIAISIKLHIGRVLISGLIKVGMVFGPILYYCSLMLSVIACPSGVLDTCVIYLCGLLSNVCLVIGVYLYNAIWLDVGIVVAAVLFNAGVCALVGVLADVAVVVFSTGLGTVRVC